MTCSLKTSEERQNCFANILSVLHALLRYGGCFESKVYVLYINALLHPIYPSM